jgi:hypothetical protein
MEAPMSQSAVEGALGRLVTDRFFRDRFFQDPAGATTSAGLDLSEVELKGLSRLPLMVINRFSLFLDDRIARPSLNEQPASEEVAK